MKKPSFSELATNIEEKAQETKLDPRKEAVIRLKSVAESQLNPGGTHEIASQWLNVSELLADIEAFTESLSQEELQRTRLFMTDIQRAYHSVHLVRTSGILFKQDYTILFEHDTRPNKTGYVIRVILNSTSPTERFYRVFSDIGFTNIDQKEVLKLTLKHLDADMGITVRQIRFCDFDAAYGKRKDYFVLAEVDDSFFRFSKPSDVNVNVYGIYDKGKLVITSPVWNRNVTLKMPTNGMKLWGYTCVKDGDLRKEATFRIPVLGAPYFMKNFTI